LPPSARRSSPGLSSCSRSSDTPARRTRWSWAPPTASRRRTRLRRSRRGGGRFTTIEGDPEQAKIAASNLAGLGLEVSVVAGRFQDVLADVLAELAPVDYVFLDGHHERNATIAYFEQILPALEEGAIVVFDDISWSEGMRDAWSVVSGHPRVAVAVDLVEVGVCVVRTEPRGRESYRLLMAPALDVPPADADG
jgi:hypothetical protein